MELSTRALVKRWGGRAIGLAITGIGLYIVAPSLLTMFDAWPQLAGVAVRWFLILAVLELGSLAALWWLAKIALASQDEAVTRLGWGATATAQLAGNSAGKVVPVAQLSAPWSRPKVPISAGQPGAAVASGLAATNLLGTASAAADGLTIPALIIGPPPVRQLSSAWSSR